jgi:hypothetical protein
LSGALWRRRSMNPGLLGPTPDVRDNVSCASLNINAERVEVPTGRLISKALS